MKADWYDGRVAERRAVTLSVAGDELLIEAEGGGDRWPLASVREISRGGGRVRLAVERREGRLTLDEGAWAALAGGRAAAAREAVRRRELRLVGGLAAVGLSFAAAVWFGIPAAAGPLARATPPELEEQIGDNFDEQLRPLFPRCRAAGGRGNHAVQDLGQQLAAESGMPFDVSVQLVHSPMVNAFALPGGKVLITDSLVALADGPGELAGVLAHEIAHVDERHVMEGVWRSFGAGLLLDLVVGGGTGAGQQAVLLGGSLTEMRYSRDAEAEADARGIELLHAAGYGSRGLSTFFGKLENERSGEQARAMAEFLSTHPDTRRRVARAARLERVGASPLTLQAWADVKADCVPIEAGIRERLRLPR